MRFQRKLLTLHTTARLRDSADWRLYWTHSVQQLRRRAVLLQLFGFTGWALSRLLARPGTPFDLSITIAGLCCGVLSLTITALSRNLAAYATGSSLGAIAITLCLYNSNVIGTHQPTFWVLPMGLLITVGMAPLFADRLSYLLSSCAVWTLVAAGHIEVLLRSEDAHWIMLMIAGGLALGTLLNHLFDQERRKTFLVQRELIRLSFYDALTGIYNRRGLMELLQECHARAATQEYYFLLIDIDNFKYINDTFGHDAGDIVLIEVAAQIKRSANDQPHGRLGGEEFGVLVPGSAEVATHFVAELCERIASIQVLAHTVTISVGIARMCGSASISDVLRLADQGMYEAKENGKDGYVLMR
ncbi:GGDEF domain-containing protein [Dyella sp. ASV21]|uniref:GGDEF domain-containing protein n=1 Tax=Dyella sp. ASV21 TaxID=2795114 RepID=UPI0018EC9C09|nr:GGDEF domain-containing protein [Dyella sp. ASV21]